MSFALQEAFPELKPPLTPIEIQEEASRCLECGGIYGPAPCTSACPSGIDIPGFIAALQGGDLASANRIVFSENPLAGTCARVCPTPVLCEGSCVLSYVGLPPVDIGRLQRAAADYARNRLTVSISPQHQAHRVAVIGAGPSGLALAAELARMGDRVTIYDENPDPGGMVRYAIAPYRQRVAPLDDEIQPLLELGVTFRFNTRIAGREAFLALESESDAIFLGVGLGADVDPQLPGQHLFGVWQALPFIRDLKEGNPLAVGRFTVVIGGGNTALDVAREALRLGSEQVTLVYRRDRQSMPAYAYEVQDAEKEGVRFNWLATPVRLLGNAWLEGIECQYQELLRDAGSRPKPRPIPGALFTLKADTAILAIGQSVRRELSEWVPGLQFEHGRLIVDAETGQTLNPQYFAGGDLVGGQSVVEAVQWAKRAAKGIHQYVAGEK